MKLARPVLSLSTPAGKFSLSRARGVIRKGS